MNRLESGTGGEEGRSRCVGRSLPVDIKDRCCNQNSNDIRLPARGKEAEPSSKNSGPFKEIHWTDEVSFDSHGYQNGRRDPFQD